MKMIAQFEHIGWFKEYYLGDKFLGSININELDREEVGYRGRRTETILEPLSIKKGLILKPGTEVRTIVYPLCGRLKNSIVK
jgi:hypothetical protein